MHRTVWNEFKSILNQQLTVCVSSDSTKSLASGIATVSEPRLTLQVGGRGCTKYCARRSVCFCNQSGGGAGILVDPVVPE